MENIFNTTAKNTIEYVPNARFMHFGRKLREKNFFL